MNRNSAKKSVFFGLSASALIALVLLIGTTLAYLVSQSTEKKNVFVPGVVDCEVSETFDGTSKSSIKVENTGNTDAYIRVAFATYWQDGDGNILADTFRMPEFDLGENWVLAADGYYYYKYPVAPGELTGDMIAAGSSIVLQSKDGNSQVIEVLSEAVQAKPDDAVVESWDSDGKGVAAVKDDESLVLYARVYDNYADGTEFETRYRMVKGTSSDRSGSYTNAYRNGLLNDSVISNEDAKLVTVTCNGSYAYISYYMVNIVEVDRVDFFVTADTADNISTIELYCGENENPDTYSNYVPETLVRSASVDENGMYVYSYKYDRTVESQFVVFKVKCTSGDAQFKVSEIKVNGYMSSRDLALKAQYRGASDTSSYYFTDYLDGESYKTDYLTFKDNDDYTKWNDYHSGVLNDTTRSSSSFDNKPTEKVLVKSDESSVKIQFKLAEPSLVDAVGLWTGPLAIGKEINSGNAFEERTRCGASEISTVRVYVSETEGELGRVLGEGTATNDSSILKVYTVEGKAIYGKYVTIEVCSDSSNADFGFNEIFIWSDGLPMLSD